MVAKKAHQNCNYACKMHHYFLWVQIKRDEFSTTIIFLHTVFLNKKRENSHTAVSQKVVVLGIRKCQWGEGLKFCLIIETLPSNYRTDFSAEIKLGIFRIPNSWWMSYFINQFSAEIQKKYQGLEIPSGNRNSPPGISGSRVHFARAIAPSLSRKK